MAVKPSFCVAMFETSPDSSIPMNNHHSNLTTPTCTARALPLLPRLLILNRLFHNASLHPPYRTLIGGPLQSRRVFQLDKGFPISQRQSKLRTAYDYRHPDYRTVVDILILLQDRRMAPMGV